ncbi:MAG: hypothetical protein AAF828_03615 [Bacteroidota bacterium]
MKSTLLIPFLLITFLLSAQEAPPLYQIKAEVGQTLSYELQLESGKILPALDWAWDSSTACFVEPRAEYFTGHHVFFQTEIATYSTMVITLIPDDPADNMSLYAYSGGRGALPPKMRSCISCEADFFQEQPSVNRPNPDHTRSVELRAVTRPYPITIGVAGANGLTTGSFTLQVSMKKNR